MPEPSSLATLRAAVDTVVPPTAGLPGAVELNVHEHVAALLEQGLPGFVDMIAALLDAYAGELRDGTGFADLDPEERGAVFRAMSSDESQDIRDAVDAILVFSYGGTFSEWSGYERATGTLAAPPTWAAVGFHGPVPGHPDYREDA